MAKEKHSLISEKDIKVLEKNGCWSADWKKVRVGKGFDARRVAGAVFQGDVYLGSLEGTLTASDKIQRNCSITNARLNNVVLGDGCCIANVNGWLSNLSVGDNVLIENVGVIACSGETAFGNGHEIEVLNEGGGRNLKITKYTSSQIAYLSVLYRDKAKLVANLEKMADDYAKKVASGIAYVGRGSAIKNAQEIVNVWLGENVEVNGAQLLKNGTIDSSAEAPTVVGHGVIAEDFIFQKGSSVKDGAVVSASLIGEGTKVGKQFSSENSVFFANSEGFHSEVCSVFGGPYTVTHHRSTLLIAGYFSFYNAGSGTNQSNHMYKLGPVHQGVLERGGKTGSFSYLLWPSRIGAFTAVIGKHYANFDTSKLPFSYINEDKGRSTIVPGMNFFTVGTLRDGEKWPTRDRRRTKEKLDLINFDVLSPFTTQKMIEGQQLLMDLHKNSEKGQAYVLYNGISIKRLLLKTCSRYYRMAVEKYFGDVLRKRIEKENPKKIRDLLTKSEKGVQAIDEWIDVCGLLCSTSRMEVLVSAIESGKVSDINAIHDSLKTICDQYDEDEWNWFLLMYEKLKGKAFAEEGDEALCKFVDDWQKSSQKLLNMVLADAGKEFDDGVKLGFGIDGNKDADFEAVRGTMDGNKFIQEIKRRSGQVEKTAEDMKKLI